MSKAEGGQPTMQDLFGEPGTISDTAALDAIHAAMNGAEWNAGLWDVVAEAVLATGRPAFLSPDEAEAEA